jgi:hypothetical protein
MKRSDIIEAEIKKLIQDDQLEFLCSQRSISLPIIYRMYHKMRLGIKFPEIKVCKNIIIDGHHRYLASKIASIDLQKIKFSEVNNLESKRWDELLFDGTDWDMPEQILKHIQTDAQYNKISIEKLLSLLE